MNHPPVAPQHERAVATGAECWRCPMHDMHLGPVPPTLPPAGPIELLIVAESPSPIEIDEGRTLVGPAGREVRQALSQGGFDPNAAAYTNAMLCRPPGGNLEDYLRECKKRGLPSPLDCCGPRLHAELGRSKYAIYVGGAAVKAAGVGESVAKLRGTPLRPDAKSSGLSLVTAPPGLATYHPNFVTRDSGRLMRGVFRFDIAKAIRLSYGGGTWEDPNYYVLTQAHELRAELRALLDDQLPIAIDTETDGIDPWTCRIRRVGVGHQGRAIIWSPLSVHGHLLCSEESYRDCVRVLVEFFALPEEWRFHNYYAYDAIVLAQHGIRVNETRLFDSLIGHHIGATSEFPHGLDFLGSIYTDAPRWKDDVKHSTTKSDNVLDKYLSFDVAVTYAAAPHIQASIVQSNQQDVYNLDVALARVGQDMSRTGVLFDAQQRMRFAIEYQIRAERLRSEFVYAAGRDVNPGSVQQLKRLFYEDFGLPVLDDFRTDSGEPSTAEPVLLELLSRGVDERARRVIHALLGWRECDKVLGTYTGRVIDGTLPRFREEDGKLKSNGLPWHADGRIRATWKVYGTTSGRWSSSPNMQNIPNDLRSMFIPAPGCVYVAADANALELRFLALLANDLPLIEAFTHFDAGTGPDIHTANACGVFRCKPEAVTKEVRNFIKRLVYALNYGALPPKIFQTLSLLRNDDFTPQFPHITMAEVERTFKMWFDSHPAILAWRKQIISSWRRHGYLATEWHGRRRYFVAGENHEEMYNFPIQGGAADLQNTAVLKLQDILTRRIGRARLILQVHDQLVVECPEGDAEAVKQALTESMESTIGPMKFPAEVKIGRNWKEVS